MVALMRAGADSDNLVTAQLGGPFLFLNHFWFLEGRLGRRISRFQLGVAGFFIFCRSVICRSVGLDVLYRADECESDLGFSVQTRDLSFAFFFSFS